MNLWLKLYRKFLNQNLNLTDQLAAVRSILANERTFLSYQRTALTLGAAGFTFLEFFDELWIEIIGWIFLPAAIFTILIGILRYIRTRNLILNLEIKTSDKNNLIDE
jgi:putative membrane protein